jgi:hypothetical protein
VRNEPGDELRRQPPLAETGGQQDLAVEHDRRFPLERLECRAEDRRGVRQPVPVEQELVAHEDGREVVRRRPGTRPPADEIGGNPRGPELEHCVADRASEAEPVGERGEAGADLALLHRLGQRLVHERPDLDIAADPDLTLLEIEEGQLAGERPERCGLPPHPTPRATRERQQRLAAPVDRGSDEKLACDRMLPVP